VILIQRNNFASIANEYVLGTVFLYGYYSLYDFTNGKIGFNGDYINFNPNKPDPTVDPTGDGGSSPGLAIIIILIAIVILGLGIFGFKHYQNKKTQQKLKEANVGLI